MNNSTELRQYFAFVRRRWWIVLLVTVTFAAIGFGISRFVTPVYQGSVVLNVGPSIEMPVPDQSRIEASRMLAQTYADIVQRQPVLQGTINALNLGDTWLDLRKRVQANLVLGTQLLEITVEAGSPEAAQAIADQIARQLIEVSAPTGLAVQQVAQRDFVNRRLVALRASIESGQSRLQELQSKLAAAPTVAVQQALQTESDLIDRLLVDWQSSYNQLMTIAQDQELGPQLTIVEPAYADPIPTRPRTALNALLAGTLGLLLALGVLFVKEQLANTVNSTQDLERDLGLMPLGAVSRVKAKRGEDRLLTITKSSPLLSEDYRIVRNSIRFLPDGQPAKVLMITSPKDGEGKTTTAANLGVAMAQTGLKTIIVDADLRQPMIHQLFQLPNESGLADLLMSSDSEVQGQLRETGFEHLQVITSGSAPSKESELLDSARLHQVLTYLDEIADVIIIDTPPLLAVADAAVVARQVDGAVLVLDVGRSTREEAQRAMSILQREGVRLLGGVLNRVPNAQAGYGYGHAVTPHERHSASSDHASGDRSTAGGSAQGGADRSEFHKQALVFHRPAFRRRPQSE